MAPSFCGVCSRNLDDEIINDGEFMIQCDVCQAWYHGKCVELEEFEAADIDDYHCPSCNSQAGPSRMKPILNTHRYDYSDADAADKPTENGTKRFIEELKKRKFKDAVGVIVKMDDGHTLTGSYLDETYFQTPVLVENPAGLGLILPPATFTADDVEKRVGGDRYVDVVDVYTQHSYKMRLRTFLEFFRQKERPKLYNLISLEFSDTELSKLVKTPDVVEELSWVDQYWPKPLRDDLSTSQKAILNEHIAARPEVSKFCLIGMAESYTDFHIDFGGTSVFYHVLWGEKVFYLIEPSEKNLRLFENWQQSIGYAERFFGDLVANCFKLVLKPGQTFFIPTGWIHAVYTPKDSLVIGGNFLHSFNIGMQIRIYEMEKRVSTAEKFMFPHFELVNWYAGVHFLDMLKELNEERTAAKPYLLEGLKSLVAGMKTWIQRNQSSSWPLANVRRSKLSGQIIIETMTCSQVLKQLDRAVRVNEKLSAPSKPKIKKPVETKQVEIRHVMAKIKQPPRPNAAPSSSRTLSPIRVAVPLPKLKVPSKSALERSKGCPKSPKKIQQQSDESFNSSSESIQPPRDQVLKKSKIKKVPPPVEKIIIGRVEKVPASASYVQQLSDVSSRGPDMDSAPPTPKWSDDTDESKDRVESLNVRIGDDAATKTSPQTVPEVQPTEIKVDTALSGDSSEKKAPVFGFSLLDIQLNSPKSPTPPVSKPKDVLASPPRTSTVPPLKLDRLASEKLGYPGQQHASSHGRVQKPNQRVVGKPASNSKAEYYPDLGYCRQDDEFVYPSLSDSEPNEPSPKKRRKSKEMSPKKSDDAFKMKLQDPLAPKKLKSPSGSSKEKKPKGSADNGRSSKPDLNESTASLASSETSKSAVAASKVKKIQKGTTKQRLANKLKIRKIIPM